MSDPRWKELGFNGLRERLVEVKDLVEQAMALSVAQDVRRLEQMTEIATRLAEEQRRMAGRGRGGR